MIDHDPSTKLSVSQKYGLESFHQQFWKRTKTNRSLTEIFDELTYQFDKDFQILSWKRGKVQRIDEILRENEGFTKAVDKPKLKTKSLQIQNKNVFFRFVQVLTLGLRAHCRQV